MPRSCSTKRTRSATRGSQAEGCPGPDERIVQPATPAAEATRAATTATTAHRRRRGGAEGGSGGVGSGQAVSQAGGATTASDGAWSMSVVIDIPARRLEGSKVPNRTELERSVRIAAVQENVSGGGLNPHPPS